MTKGIENTLGLRSLEEALASFGAVSVDEEESESFDLSLGGEYEGLYDEEGERLAKEIDQRLAMTVSDARRDELSEQMLTGKDSEDRMDKLYVEFLRHSETLTELAMELDPGRAPRAFEVANAFLKHALDTVNSKRDNQLKTMKLMLEQKKMELEERKLNNAAGGAAGVIQAEATVMHVDTADMLRDLHKQWQVISETQGTVPGETEPK